MHVILTGLPQSKVNLAYTYDGQTLNRPYNRCAIGHIIDVLRMVEIWKFSLDLLILVEANSMFLFFKCI